MTLQLVLVALIVSAGLYGAIAYWKSRDIKSIRHFFHIDTVRDGSLSIVAGNLTLGTGLFYVASLAQSQALFALVAPLGVFIGYKILGRTVASLSIELEGADHNILDSIRTGNGGRLFYKFVSIIIVLTYIILIPFEIYVSSSLFASVLPASHAADMAIVFAVVLFFVVVGYSTLGGLKGIVATDLIQLGFIAAMILIVFAGSFYFNKGDGFGSIGLLPTGSISSIIVVCSVSFITAVATQMYNIINLTVGASFNSSNQVKLYSLASKVLVIALVLFVLTGLATKGLGQSNLAGIDILLNRISANGESFSFIIFLVVFGMVAVLISTADSGIMAISHLTYKNLLNNNSMSNEGGKKLLMVRLVYVVLVNTISAVPLFLLFKHQPQLVPCLFASISALTVASPFFVSSAVNIARYKKCLLFDWKISSFIILIVLSVWSIAIWRAFSGDNQTGNYLILGGVAIGLAYYKIDGLQSKQQ